LLENIYSILKERILNGEYLPGVHLVEADLTNEFPVSRVTIREALRRLMGDGLVELIPHRGVRVRKLTSTEIRDMYLVLEYLEGLAARLLTELGDTSVLDQLKNIIDQDIIAVTNQNFQLHLELMINFHSLIAEGSKNLALIKSIERLHLLSRSTQAVWPLEERMALSLQSHKKILEAIISGNGDLAETTMRKHQRETLERISNAKRGEI